MPHRIASILQNQRPALLIGNGINRYRNSVDSSWEALLSALAEQRGLPATVDPREMSNTEFFDLLELSRSTEDSSDLKADFCKLISKWQPAAHHTGIVGWARGQQRPIITVNFDENLSASVNAKFFRGKKPFTDYYPWRSYFADQEVDAPRSNFAIWHAHGVVGYKRSIRLGLIDYMGSVERARRLIYRLDGLRSYAKTDEPGWMGSDTWLDAFFFCPLLIIGFGLGKDETFLRWLLLERARLHRIRQDWRAGTWFVYSDTQDPERRRPFFEALGIDVVNIPAYEDIYENEAWRA